MPVGNDASPALLPTPEQRIETYRRIRKYRAEKPLFAMDFQNDAEFVDGCIAGGRRYLHINANGDVDPCVFVHYSDSNIREKTLLQALQSPMMMAYHDGQPFNENMLRPCPMLENPEKLRAMVNASGAHSTDLQSPESVEHLCAKCDQYAAHWKHPSEELWKENRAEREAQKAAEIREEPEHDSRPKPRTETTGAGKLLAFRLLLFSCSVEGLQYTLQFVQTFLKHLQRTAYGFGTGQIHAGNLQLVDGIHAAAGGQEFQIIRCISGFQNPVGDGYSRAKTCGILVHIKRCVKMGIRAHSTSCSGLFTAPS